jgi:hypothetical protein
MGPGLTNAVNVIANAHQDLVPMLVISGCVDTALAESDTHQIIDHKALLRPITEVTLQGTPAGRGRHGGSGDRQGDLAADRVDDRTLVFADLHYALALAGAGRDADAGLLGLGMQHDSRPGHDARLVREFGAAVTDAIRAFRGRRYGEAARLLVGVRTTLVQIGGSHAQRDIFEQMLI